MNKATWWFLYRMNRLPGGLGRWLWTHTPEATRRTWANIAAAMMSRTLHMNLWGDGDPEWAIPSWVTCHPCGGTGGCTLDPDVEAVALNPGHRW